MVASCACSGPATPGGQTPRPPPDAAVARRGPDAVPFANQAQCDQMITHAVDLAAAQSDVTPEERVQLERETAAKHGPDCLTQEASVIECAIAAPSLDDFAACSGHAQ